MDKGVLDVKWSESSINIEKVVWEWWMKLDKSKRECSI